MGETSIQWTQKTWNPAHGCRKVSEGCKFCYMYRDKTRYGQDPAKVVRSKTTFYDPLKWKEPALVFTCSWSDWFIEEIDEYRDEMWEIIRKTPHLTYQILTKRPENIKDRLPKDWGEGYPNVWLGVSVENQKAADERIPILLDTPAALRFLSCEPLLEWIDIGNYLYTRFQMSGLHHEFNAIDWVIIGGESGHETGYYRYRPCEFQWLYFLVAQCRVAKVPVFVKQIGTYLAKSLGLKDNHGGDINEWPEDLRIRQMPEGESE